MSVIGYLGIEQKHRTIAVVGGGGKTTLIFTLADAFANMGKRVCITTTTKMMAVPNTTHYTQLGSSYEKDPQKITALPEEKYRELRSLYDIVLVEADGAKRLPIKAPGLQEPVIPSDADLVIGILGASAIGKPLSETCFRFERTSEVLGVPITYIVTLEDLLCLLDSPFGQRKGVHTDYRMVIGQGDLLLEDGLPTGYYSFSVKENYEDFFDFASGRQ